MSRANDRKVQASLVIGTLAVAMVSLLFISLNPLPSRNAKTGVTGVNCTTYRSDFLIIADSRGYNDSIDHGVPQNYWPILCVHEGSTVRITVENTGSEPHGFAIGHYYEGGISLAEGRSITITIVADQRGAFSIFCTILCSVHPWMLSGLLVVR